MTPIQQVQTETCRIWGITMLDLLGPSRKREYVTARHSAMVVCIDVLGELPQRVDREFSRSKNVAAYARGTHRKDRFTKADWNRFLELIKVSEQLNNKSPITLPSVIS